LISKYGREDRFLVYCFRGGKRSRLRADSLRTIGFQVDVLAGGWKGIGNGFASPWRPYRRISRTRFWPVRRGVARRGCSLLCQLGSTSTGSHPARSSLRSAKRATPPLARRHTRRADDPSRSRGAHSFWSAPAEYDSRERESEKCDTKYQRGLLRETATTRSNGATNIAKKPRAETICFFKFLSSLINQSVLGGNAGGCRPRRHPQLRV